jgi:GrpB-like predicted nucleotidyltransferase (UPF0157 family)
MREVKVVPYDGHWRKMFEEESAKIKSFMEDNIIDMHHIGSTSIPGMVAKPIIDLLVEVK